MSVDVYSAAMQRCDALPNHDRRNVPCGECVRFVANAALTEAVNLAYDRDRGARQWLRIELEGALEALQKIAAEPASAKKVAEEALRDPALTATAWLDVVKRARLYRKDPSSARFAALGEALDRLDAPAADPVESPRVEKSTRILTINRRLRSFCRERPLFNGEEGEPASACHASRDGDCNHARCPQEMEGRAFYQKSCPLWHVASGDQDGIARVYAIIGETH